MRAYIFFSISLACGICKKYALVYLFMCLSPFASFGFLGSLLLKSPSPYSYRVYEGHLLCNEIVNIYPLTYINRISCKPYILKQIKELSLKKRFCIEDIKNDDFIVKSVVFTCKFSRFGVKNVNILHIENKKLSLLNHFFYKKNIEISNFFQSSPYAWVFRAIILGNKSELKRNNIFYIFCMSGIHLSILSNFMLIFFRKLLSLHESVNYFKIFRIPVVYFPEFLCLLFIFYFGSLCAWPISIQRIFVFKLLKCKFKYYSSFFLLNLCFIVMLIYNPLYIYNNSFILSFLSVAALEITPFIPLFSIWIIPKIQILGFFINIFLLKIFPVFLVCIFVSVIFSSSFLLQISEFLLDVIFKIQIPSLKVTVEMHEYYGIFIFLSILFKKSYVIYMGFFYLILYNFYYFLF